MTMCGRWVAWVVGLQWYGASAYCTSLPTALLHATGRCSVAGAVVSDRSVLAAAGAWSMSKDRVTTAPSGVTSNRISSLSSTYGESGTHGVSKRGMDGDSAVHANPPPSSRGAQETASPASGIVPMSTSKRSSGRRVPLSDQTTWIAPEVPVAWRVTARSAPWRTSSGGYETAVFTLPVHTAFAVTSRLNQVSDAGSIPTIWYPPRSADPLAMGTANESTVSAASRGRPARRTTASSSIRWTWIPPRARAAK